MSKYVPDDAAMTHGDYDPMEREQTKHRRTMNILQARKDRLLDLLDTRPPMDERQRLNDELAELKQDIAENRYDESERTWLDLERKWGRRS